MEDEIEEMPKEEGQDGSSDKSNNDESGQKTMKKAGCMAAAIPGCGCGAGLALFILGVGLGLVILISPVVTFQAIGQQIGFFVNRFGNLLTAGLPMTDQELLEHRTEQFYNKLDETYDEYVETYAVAINKELIVATLFYDRMFGDYGDDNTKFEHEVPSEDLNFTETMIETIFSFFTNLFGGGTSKEKQEATLMNTARGHIKTLANYMLLTNEVINKCGSSYSRVVDPDNPKDIVKRNAPSLKVEIFPDFDGQGGSITVPIGYNIRTITTTYGPQPYSLNDIAECPTDDITQIVIDKFEEARKEGGDAQQWIDMGFIVPGKDYAKDPSDYSFKCALDYESNETRVHRYAKFNGCAKLPTKAYTFEIDPSREGIYYWRLLEPIPDISSFWGGEAPSFIEAYYAKYYVGEEQFNFAETGDGEYNEVKAEEIVNEIYDLALVVQPNGPGGGMDSGGGDPTDPTNPGGPSTGGPGSGITGPVRTGPPALDNKFYSNASINRFYNSGIVGGYNPYQCTTYAYGRALEMRDYLNMPWQHISINGHAGTWCSNTSYPKSYDPSQAEYGAWIVWARAGEYGHVGIVEKVEGNLVQYSEGNMRNGAPMGWNLSGLLPWDTHNHIKTRSWGLSFVCYIYQMQV